ncbi:MULTISPECIES: hypothetical protein [unclassified Pseudodesulfovibrio]|uniref:hypothetical protein n=1 Tax=unclassified Pseudodesulfovibrio TaxID=2661612 RepID=UPI000FEB72F6|nr:MULTISPECIES: hypothetical protein [unclassified Pseudodesulfovibrio]MCJ2165230.1 hypothetical protein [Pseudodesulfovibrio sp. S3-i]RWU03284.1 hypothetical protein DWB63_11820 [Pseudodesulfovibrio sp. S3]
MTQVEEKKGFSWMGLLFGGAYYAGYGELGKGIIMGAITGLFLVPGLFVHLFAGIKGKKDLPVGKQPFDWPKAICVAFVHAVVYMATLGIIAIIVK